MIDLTKTKYETLRAGDVRTLGDEQREFDITRNHVPGTSHTTTKLRPWKWHEVALLGHVILASDLMHIEFRRPV